MSSGLYQYENILPYKEVFLQFAKDGDEDDDYLGDEDDMMRMIVMEMMSEAKFCTNCSRKYDNFIKASNHKECQAST